MTDLEHDLRGLFAEEADRAPTGADLVQGTRRRLRHRRSLGGAWSAGVLVAASVAGVALISSGVLSADQTPQHGTARSGALPMPADASCIIYSPENVSTLMDFAFDGSVKAIGPTHPSRSEAYPAVIATTIDVNEWYRGGSAKSVIVDIPTKASIDPMPPPFEVGTRLLVSGMNAPDNHVAQNVASGCGYTRYYNKSTAGAWQAAAR
jgi:hypothetical protein